MGLTHVAVQIKNLSSGASYNSQFLVDTGSLDTFVPACELIKIGIEPVGKDLYELADGSIIESEFGLAEIDFMNQITAGRVVFGPDEAEPILGVLALEAAGMVVDPTNLKLHRLSALSLKKLEKLSTRC